MKNLHETIEKIERARIAYSKHQIIKLVAVSKSVGVPEIADLYNQGQRAFGENRVQDLAKKVNELENLPLEWHFIGTLQSNKINQLLALKPSLWQSCNSFSLAAAVDKRLNYQLDTLLEINCAAEDSKTGIEINRALDEYLQIKENCKKLNLRGVMCIGAHNDDKNSIKKSFEDTFSIYEKLIPQGAIICSMGMSDDFELAISCGSNMVRLGSILF